MIMVVDFYGTKAALAKESYGKRYFLVNSRWGQRQTSQAFYSREAEHWGSIKPAHTAWEVDAQTIRPLLW